MQGIENGGPLLMVDSVTKRYKLPSGYEVEALGGISLELRKGEMLGLFGPNGAGKTTLVNIITGLISADSGSVKWGDIERNRRFGYVSQKGGLQYGLTCREEMEFQARCYGQSKRAARASVERVSEILGCSYLLDWQVGRLSGGQRRIVEIGLALVGSPAVIILDEPTLGLDPAVRISLWQAIQSARDSTMSAFLITTHYIEEVADYLSAVKILDHGREVASGNPSALERNFGKGNVTVRVASQCVAMTQSLVFRRFDNVSVDGSIFTFESSEPEALAVEILAYLLHHRISVESISSRKATLESAFLALTASTNE